LPADDAEKKLRLRSIADLTLVHPAPVLTTGYIAFGGAGILVIGGIVALWVLTLRGSIRRKTEEIQLLLARAEEASRAKSEFLATVSHEIRTPLNGVLGMQELVLATQLTPEQRNFIQEAQACTRSLLALLNDVLDLSKIEAGRLTLAQEAFEVHQLISDTLRPVQAEIVRKKLEFRNDVQPDLPNVLAGDPVRLRQVLMNLLSNAVKFTDKGAITLKVAGRPTEDGRVHVTFAVTDTGIGISPEHQSRIFDSFRQADGSIARRFGGTGLGLAIASRLVGMMGGKLIVSSTEGAGSTFSFTIVLAAVEANLVRTADLHEVPAVPGRRILVVEDNAVNRRVAEVILRRAGYIVESATEGHEALRLVSTSHFDAILMDVQMPDMDGLQVTRTIRTNFPEPSASVPIIALTANVMPGDVEKCIAAGMNGYVAKPFHSRELIAAIEAHATKARTASVAE
jgi:signal transduction histidine kinase/CheY-like chemotaxis protein